MRVLKANSGVTILVGPLVSYGDGVTPITTYTLATADSAVAVKNGSGSSFDISGRTWTHVVAGYYNITFTAGDTDTNGNFTLVLSDPDVIAPVFEHFIVKEEEAFNNEFVGAPSMEIVAGFSPTATEFRSDRTETLDDVFKDSLVQVVAGNYVGAVRLITAYNGTTKNFTTEAFPAALTIGDTLKIINE